MRKTTFCFICLLLLFGRDAFTESTESKGSYIKVKSTDYLQFVEDVKQLEIKAQELAALNKSLKVECDRLAEDNEVLSDKVQYAEMQNRRLIITLCISTPVAITVGVASTIIWNNYHELRK